MLDRLALWAAFLTCTGASMMFSSAVMCGKRLKRWKTMPILARWAAMLRSLSSTMRSSVLAVADQLAAHVDAPAVDLLQVVDAAQEGGLARAAGPDHAPPSPRLHGQVDALAAPRCARSAYARPPPARWPGRWPRADAVSRSLSASLHPTSIDDRVQLAGAEDVACARGPRSRAALLAILRSPRRVSSQLWTQVQTVVMAR